MVVGECSTNDLLAGEGDGAERFEIERLSALCTG